MALSCKQGSFTKSTGANGTTQSVTIGFQAKAIIFWWTDQTAQGYTDGHKIGIGIADATAVNTGNKVVFGISEDNVATSNTQRVEDDDKCILIVSSAAVLQQASYVSAIDSTSFTLTHETNTANATIIHYFAIGGSDITNTKADKFITPLVTGSQSITSLAFQPDLIFMISRKHSSLGSTNNTELTLGMASSSSNQSAIAITSENGRTTMDTWRHQIIDNCITQLIPNSGAQGGLASFTQFTSTGFDINWTNVDAATAANIYFLAIKGGSPFVGNLLQPTSNGIQTYSTTAAKTPRGVMLFSVNGTASSSIVANSRMIIGGTDGVSEGVAFSGDNDNVAPSVTANNILTTKTIINPGTPNATGASTTTNADAGIDSFNSGNFKLNWTTTDATQREVLFVAFSEAVAGGTTMTEVAAKTHSNKFITKV